MKPVSPRRLRGCSMMASEESESAVTVRRVGANSIKLFTMMRCTVVTAPKAWDSYDHFCKNKDEGGTIGK